MPPAWDDLWRPEGPRILRHRILLPALRAVELAFRIGVDWRERFYRDGGRHAERAPIPVISVGGLETGGVGKTPAALELARLAAAAGLAPAIVSRGYRPSRWIRRSRSGTRAGVLEPRAQRVTVPLPGDAAERFGDEPAWLAEQVATLPGAAGVWIGPRRIHAVRAAAEGGARLALLDDGFQHRRLHRDGEVVCLTGTAPFGNGHLLPAGPLREPPCALRRADRVLLSARDPASAVVAIEAVRRHLSPEATIHTWRGEPGLRALVGDPPHSGEAVLVLAGIAHPERLLTALDGLGHPVLRHHWFPDHHPYTEDNLGACLRELVPSRRSGGAAPALVTTEKDWVRLRALRGAGWLSSGDGPVRLALLTQTFHWNDPQAETDWTHWLRAIAGAGPRRI